MSADDTDPPLRAQHAWLTLAAIGVSALIWLVAQTGLIHDSFGTAEVHALHGRRWWALFTSPWVHFQLWHLAFNCYWLWIFGSRIERALGPGPYAALIAVAALVSGMAEAWWDGSTGHGASGVVYALFGFLAVQRRDPRYAAAVGPQVIVLLLVWLVACMAMAASIANAAHIGGLVVGAALGLVPSSRWRAAGVVATLLLLAASMAALLHPPHQAQPPAAATS